MATVTRGTLGTGDGTGSSTTVATGAVVATAGRLLVAEVGFEGTGSETLSSVADTAGGTWAFSSTVVGSSLVSSAVAWCLSTPGHSSNVVTATFSAAVAFRSIRVQEYAVDSSGTWAVVAGEGTSSGTGGPGGPIVSTTLTTTLPNAVLGYAICTTNSPQGFTDNNGWNELYQASFDSQSGFDVIKTSTGTWSASVTLDDGDVSGWALLLKAFQFTVIPTVYGSYARMGLRLA